MTASTGMPEAGAKAPDFSGLAHGGETIRLAELRGKFVVLYFYPKDNTPGCTVEAKEFRDAMEDLAAAGAVVVGVSTDSLESHCKFVARFELNFALLADESHEIAEKYGVWVEKNMYGRKYMGIQRATFLIDPKGKIAAVWPKVRPQGHAAQVLAALEAAAG